MRTRSDFGVIEWSYLTIFVPLFISLGCCFSLTISRAIADIMRPGKSLLGSAPVRLFQFSSLNLLLGT